MLGLDQALALPPVFATPTPNWRIIQMLTDALNWCYVHRWDFFAFYALRWLALSLFFAVAWSIILTLFGHPRDDEDDDH